jgi:hypothetical protein
MLWIQKKARRPPRVTGRTWWLCGVEDQVAGGSLIVWEPEYSSMTS